MAGGHRTSAQWFCYLALALATILVTASCRTGKEDGDQGTSESLATRSNAARSAASPAQKSKDPNAIVIVFGDRYEPFAWGDGAAVRGVQVDFVNEILVQRMGLDVVVEGCPWKRCQNWVAEGKKDGFFTVLTEERKDYTHPSVIPFYETHFVMHVKADNPIATKLKHVHGLHDLEQMPDLRHIHMLGSGWHENALKNMGRVMTVPNASVIPQMLVLGRADVYIEQAEMFKYQAKSAGVDDQLTTLYEPSIMKVDWHLFIGKNSKHRTVVPEIDKALLSLQASGELEAIKQRIFDKYGI